MISTHWYTNTQDQGTNPTITVTDLTPDAFWLWGIKLQPVANSLWGERFDFFCPVLCPVWHCHLTLTMWFWWAVLPPPNHWPQEWTLDPEEPIRALSKIHYEANEKHRCSLGLQTLKSKRISNCQGSSLLSKNEANRAKKNTKGKKEENWRHCFVFWILDTPEANFSFGLHGYISELINSPFLCVHII